MHETTVSTIGHRTSTLKFITEGRISVQQMVDERWNYIKIFVLF